MLTEDAILAQLFKLNHERVIVSANALQARYSTVGRLNEGHDQLAHIVLQENCSELLRWVGRNNDNSRL